MVTADEYKTSAPPDVAWEADESCLRCVVGWPGGGRPPLAQVLPLFEHLGLVLIDHRPEEAADSFVFSRVEDADLDELLPLLADAFTAGWERSVDRDEFASLVLQAHLQSRQVQLVRVVCHYLRQAGLGASPSYVRGILSAHPDFVRHWVEMFEQRFAPEAPASVENRLAKYVDAATTRDEFRVLDQAIRAILIVKDLLNLNELWDGLAPYPVSPRMPFRQALERALEYNASWLVRRNSRLAAIDAEAAVFRAGVTRLRDAMASSQPVAAGSALGRSLAALADLGASPNLLTACHAVARMQAGLALASAATDRGFDVVELEAIYARIGETLGLSWLYATIPINVADPHWVQLAKAALRDELAALTVAIALDALAAGGLQAWMRLHEDALARAHSAYAGLAGSIEVDVAMLTVGVQVLRDLCHAVGVRE